MGLMSPNLSLRRLSDRFCLAFVLRQLKTSNLNLQELKGANDRKSRRLGGLKMQTLYHNLPSRSRRNVLATSSSKPLLPSRRSLWSTLLLFITAWHFRGIVMIPPVEMLPVRVTLFRAGGSSCVSRCSGLLFRLWV